MGWVGGSYANEFKKRGCSLICYALEEPYIQNKDKIRECEIVFVAVPTPTTPAGPDISILQDVMKLIGTGHIGVIKSTVLPGTTVAIQDMYPEIIVLHSP